MGGGPDVDQHGTVCRRGTRVKVNVEAVVADEIGGAMDRDTKEHAFGELGHVPERAGFVLGGDGEQQRTIEGQRA